MTAGAILAHGIGGRSDLPVPLWLAQYGAAAALLVSFTVLALFWRTPRLGGAGSGRGPRPPSPRAGSGFASARGAGAAGGGTSGVDGLSAGVSVRDSRTAAGSAAAFRF